MMTTPRSLRLPALLIASALVAGCSAFEVSADQMPEGHADDHTTEAADIDGHDHAEDTARIDSAEEVTVVADALRFQPARIELAAGEPVNFALRSEDILHDLTIDESDFHVAADAGVTATGGLDSLEPGTYVAYCSVAGHREAGMELEIVVGGS